MENQNAPARAMSEGVEGRFAGDFNVLTTGTNPLQQQRQRKPILGLRYTAEQVEAAATERLCEWRVEWSLRRIREGRHDSHRPISKAEAGERPKSALRLLEGGER